MSTIELDNTSVIVLSLIIKTMFHKSYKRIIDGK